MPGRLLPAGAGPLLDWAPGRGPDPSDSGVVSTPRPAMLDWFGRGREARMAEPQDPGTGDVPYLATVLAVVIGGAFVALLLATWRGGFAAIGIGILVFLSAFAAGVILGFIFSVPRIRNPAADPDPASGAADAPAPADGADAGGMRRLLFTNTAMERISEWLATMLVGVGLSQLTNLNSMLVGFRDFLAANGPPGSFLPVAGPMILILGVVAGFMFMYVYTRLILPRHFYRAEQVNVGLIDPAAARVVREAAAGAQAAAPELAETTGAGAGPAGVAQGQFLKRAQTAHKLDESDAIGVMFDLLYRPGGYRQVIEMGNRLRDTPLARRADFWKYLAAAWGQAHAAAAPGTAEASAARLHVLDAVRRAIDLDPSSMPAQLWFLAQDGTDNDLATLRDDAEFRSLIGATAR